MAPKVLLPCEPLATGLAGVRPLTSVGSDMPLEDALLLGSVRAERTLVELDGDHQHVTWGIHKTVNSINHSQLAEWDWETPSSQTEGESTTRPASKQQDASSCPILSGSGTVKGQVC